MATYTSVDRDKIRRALALAHSASEDSSIPQIVRKRFFTIAHTIWKALGEDGAVPPGWGTRTLAALSHVENLGTRAVSKL